MIPQMEPSFDENEANALFAYMQAGGWVTEFKKTREFERVIAEYTGATYCSVVTNGTLSLTIALLACGVKPGDEVICPDFTMVATPNAGELIGAKTVFVDVEPDTGCMDFEKMCSAVTPQTRAVMLVTINGRCPKNMDAFVSFCKENHIWLIEDAAQSLGSRYKGQHLGTFGDIGSFSFSAPKIITTGQGGALVTNNSELFDRIVKIRDFGRESGGNDNYLVKGWNFKFTDIQAIIGIEQMKKINDRVKRKKELGQLYESRLKNIPSVRLFNTDYEHTVPWFFDLYVEKREELMAFLKKHDIGTRPMYPALHSSPAYGLTGSFPAAEEIATKGLWLPSSVKLTNDEVHEVCDRIEEFFS